MQIKDIRYKVISIPLVKPFRIAFTTQDTMVSVIVRIETESGLIGYGEAVPFELVTGETIETVQATLELFRKVLIGQDAASIAELHRIMNATIRGNTAAKAGIDIAAHDLLGKRANLPLYRLLGGMSNQLETDMTIGINPIDEMVQDAKDNVAKGFRILKIKCGQDPETDIEAIHKIREAVGPNIRLRLDANQGWNMVTADKVLRALEDCDIQGVEQPLQQDDLIGMKEIRQAHDIAIIADESCKTPIDAHRLVADRCCDMVNIKLMKSGGLYPAMQINAICEAANIHAMVGCMVETKLAITAAASLVAAQNNIIEADVDSAFYFKETEQVRGGIVCENGIVTLPEKPGLGVEVNVF